MRNDALSVDDQQVVDDAVSQLQAAYDALEEKSGESEDPENPDNPDNPGTTDPDDNNPGAANPDDNNQGSAGSDQTKPGATTDKAGSGNAVKTGDSSPIVLWAVLVIAAAGAVTGVTVVRKKKSGR